MVGGYRDGWEPNAALADRAALEAEVERLREALLALVDNAGGYDKSIVRALALQARGNSDDPTFRALAARVLAAEEQARAVLAAPAERTARDGDIADAPEPWVQNRDRWLQKGYDIHSYHGFKAGPLPGCNAIYGNIPCSASIDEHCHCGSGDHLALAAPAERRGEG